MEYKDMSENILNRREIDQLKEMLEEKDRHIGDLTDTLTHFHVSESIPYLYIKPKFHHFTIYIPIGRSAEIHKRHIPSLSGTSVPVECGFKSM